MFKGTWLEVLGLLKIYEGSTFFNGVGYNENLVAGVFSNSYDNLVSPFENLVVFSWKLSYKLVSPL